MYHYRRVVWASGSVEGKHVKHVASVDGVSPGWPRSSGLWSPDSAVWSLLHGGLWGELGEQAFELTMPHAVSVQFDCIACPTPEAPHTASLDSRSRRNNVTLCVKHASFVTKHQSSSVPGTHRHFQSRTAPGQLGPLQIDFADCLSDSSLSGMRTLPQRKVETKLAADF